MADSVKILNAVRGSASTLYQERIPTATKANLADIASKLAEYQPQMNEFLNLLVNKIAMTIVSNKRIKNPLELLKSGSLPMGNHIEEIFTNPAISKDYSLTSEDMLKVTKPDVKALYYSINRQAKYPVTIAEDTILKAVTSDSSMGSLISSITTSLYSGDSMDEFLLMKQLVATATKTDMVIKKTLTFTPDKMTKANAEELIKLLRTDSQLISFPSSEYNSYSKIKPAEDTGKDVITFTQVEDQILLIDSRVYSAVNVDVLASAFNMDKTDFIGKVIPVDNFNGEPVIAMLVDKAWFKVYDNLTKMTSLYNPDTLNYSYWYHRWQVMSFSMFANAIAYTYTPVVPTAE